MDPLKKRKLEENGVVLAELTIEDARKILEPLTHEQLFEIVQNAVIRHADVLDAVRLIADRDTTQRKLFIRGLGWETNTEKLRALFGQYGELEEAVVILDKATGKSKGYGFITFKHIDGALRALKQPSKQIDGRMTVTQLAAAGVSGGGPAGGGIGGGGSNSGDVSSRKIYVANVPYDMPGERLLQHFSMYGEIEEGPLGFDKATGKSKGFALFVYGTQEAARASLVDPIKNIDGHQLNCKMANDGKKGKTGGPGGVQGGANGQGNGVGSGFPVGGQYGGPGGVGGMSNYAGYSGANTVGGNPLSSTLGAGAAGAGAGAVGVGGTGGYGSGIGGHYSGGSHFGGPGGSTGYGGLSGAGGGLSGVGGGLGGAGSGGLGGAGGVLGGTGAGLGSAGGGLGSAGSGSGGSGSGFGGAGGGLGGGAGSGLGAAAGGLSGVGSGLGGAGRGSSLYGMAPGSAGIHSGEYPQSAHYSLSSSSGYQNQHHLAAGTSPAPRLPPGGSYQGMPPYY